MGIKRATPTEESWVIIGFSVLVRTGPKHNKMLFSPPQNWQRFLSIPCFSPPNCLDGMLRTTHASTGKVKDQFWLAKTEEQELSIVSFDCSHCPGSSAKKGLFKHMLFKDPCELEMLGT